ncbi:MAG: RAD55 family ATPase [Euryarchaeota archaeon]|nr:RAD55 family ATPase [Euryarchaeota archaeon]
MVLTDIGLEEIPQNSVLLIEEDLGSIKSVFIQRVGFDALKIGKKVLYISTKRSNDDVLDQMAMFGLNGNSDGFTILGDFKDLTALLDMCREDTLKHRNLYHLIDPSLQNISEMDLCIVDTFTSLFIDEEIHILVDALNSLINVSRYSGTTFLLAADTGILPERAERIMRSMVDGIIQFRTVHAGDKINRFINIPKLKGVLPMGKMIPFYITGDGISIDTRERVG